MRSYHPRCGERYDSRGDKSPSQEPAGTREFSREIHVALIPPCFRQPSILTKYSGETNPRVWLNNYRLACQLGGAMDDAIIIRNLPLHLADLAWTWLEHLPTNQIFDWDDLVETFVGNFQGTYVHPGNSWDLQGCRQALGESLRDFIRRFSKRSRAWETQRSSMPFSKARLVGTSCTSWDGPLHAVSTSCLTWLPTLLMERKRLVPSFTTRRGST